MFNDSSFPWKKTLLPSWPSLKRFLLVLGGVSMILCLNFYIVHFFADDLFFIHQDKRSLLSTLVDRYQNRTSRVLLEALLFYFAHHLLHWKLINSLMMIGFAFFLALYTTTKRKVFHSYLAILFFFAVPLKVFQTSGWMTSSVNYLWPMTAALIGLFPIVNWYRNKHRSSSELQFLCNAFLIFACNSEYEALFVLLLMIGLLSYSYIKEGKIPRIVLLPALISYLSLLFAFHAPGNTVRWLQEAHANFKNFQQVSLIHKLDLSFSSTCYEFFFNTNLLSLFFFSLILFSVIRNHASHFVGFAAFMPTVILLGSVLRSLFIHQNTQSMAARTLNSVTTQLFPHDELLFALLFFLTLWALLHSVKRLRTGLFLCFIFLAGFTLRMVVGFTPMIWSEDFRTFFIFYVCILYVSLIIYQELFHLPLTKYLVLFFNLACIVSFVGLL